MTTNVKIVNVTSVPVFERQNGVKYSFTSYPSAEAASSNSRTSPNLLDHPIEIANYFCQHCSLTFEDVLEFEHHNIEMHGQRKVLTCHVCTATFKRQDHLKRHMQSLHLNQKYCMCPVCGKDCKRQDILLKHIKRKHTSDSEIFHCRECNYQCNSHTELEKHEFTHIATERHMCQHCKTTFKRRDHMLRHVKSQHLNQFAICPICNQTYKRKDHVVRHVREKHKMGYLNGKLITSSDML